MLSLWDEVAVPTIRASQNRGDATQNLIDKFHHPQLQAEADCNFSDFIVWLSQTLRN